MDKVKMKKNTFRHDKKPAAETQVFMDEEKNLLEEIILKEFTDNPEYGTTGLALILLFQTGLRSGEIASLKTKDIKNNYLTVERTETAYRIVNPDGTNSKTIYDIKEFSKSTDSNRDIPLSKKSKHIIELAINWNKSHGFDTNDFLFLNHDEERVIRKTLDILNDVL